MFSLAIALTWHAAPVWAQEAEGVAEAQDVSVDEGATGDVREVYTPADFARFAPRNALDLIEQLPGFDVDRGGGGGGGGRGFGQASENLLINGERISSKSTSTADQLARISVEQVVRIEVVDGATLDIPGLSGRVANIIVQQGGAAGQFRWRPEWNFGTAPAQWFEGEISLTGQVGGVDYTLALENRDFARGRSGPSIITLADGTVDERLNSQSNLFNRPNLNAFLSFDIAPEVAVNLNLSGGIEIFDSEEVEARIASNPLTPFVETFDTRSDEWYYEIGGDITFPLAGGELKLIALESFDHGDRTSTSLLDQQGSELSGSQFIRVFDRGERIGRAEYSWGMLGADFQLSGEAAFNRLDQEGRLFDFDPVQGDYVETTFDGGVGGVREDRYEALLSVGFSLTENLSVQLIGGGEYSQLSQTGDNARSRSFQRPKGSLSLAWAPIDGLDINVEVARRVGQLDFGDFLSSVNLSEEQQNAGNSDLRPQQSWELELEIAKNFGEWGSATLTLFDQEIEDLLVIVPLANGGAARGNLDSASRYGLDFNGTLQLAPLGLEGGQLDLIVRWEDSELIDPVTDVARRFDRNDPFAFRFDFRHDVPRTDWAWGWSFEDVERAPGYRVTQEILEHGANTQAAVFIEHKDVFGATANLRLVDLLDREDFLFRTVYDGPRNTAPVLFTEERRRDLGQRITLTLTGSF
ncbi:TonB-dependent receptor plug domain-containing protein [Aurantiacibacter sp. D1-12]|uniref:TonB-dependent receptor plug domain-containing protein n=1 Tax=Aurantiacibacter sp. D1-12 TaxID=2993658 RepID=UPI00237CBADA|nr:TonB-dependent receptor [Aurantiacibacter sp. D1-12]MDE1467061.1 TonB-dependent receptor plug domain-containing protein [Aurantiacibacter sp. D1-12]